MNKKDSLINYKVIVIIFVIFLVFAYLTGLLTSGFRYFIDDNQIFLMKDDLANQGWLKTAYQWILYDRNLLRFRPYYEFHVVTLTQLFGINSVLWFLYITILGSLTCSFLFLFGRTLNFSTPIALIFSVSVLLGSQSETWMRPLIPDGLGMFFLSFALWILGITCRMSTPPKIANIFFIILVTLMSLSKESYILFIPTIITLKIYLTSYFQQKSLRNTIQESRWILIVLTTIFIMELVYILFFLGTKATGYAGVDEGSFQIFSLSITAFQLLNAGFIGFTVIVVSIYSLVTIIKQQDLSTFFQELKPFVILLLIALIPQTLLYAKSGIMAGFYLFPFITVSCLLLAKALSLVEQKYYFLATAMVTGLSLILMMSLLPPVWKTYTVVAQDSRILNKLITQIEICVKKDQPILVVANPKVRFEAVDSFQRVFRTKGYQNLYLVTYGLKDADFYSDKLADTEEYWSFLDPKILLGSYNQKNLTSLVDKSSLQGIIIFDGLDNEFKKTQQTWFFPHHYRSQEFPVTFAPFNFYCKTDD